MTNEQPADRTAPNRPFNTKHGAASATLFVGLRLIAALGALTLVFWLGSQFGSGAASPHTPSAPAHSADGDVAYWTCSMHPQIRQPKPGSCPICGMELVPVPGGEPSPNAKKVKYACAMLCVPPMERPGKCPVCGMDMVPVVDDPDEETSSEPGAPTALSEISLSATARTLARLETAPVERRFVAAEIRMVGKVYFDETRQRTISARVAGRLDRLFVDYTGVPVNKGDHLVYLYSPELLGAQEELIQSLMAFENLPANASVGTQRVRNEALEAARQKLLLWGLTADQVGETERRGIPSDHLTIYAPIGGIVTEKRLVEGAYVEEGTEIYTIADLTHLWVKLDAYELDLTWLRYGQAVEFSAEAYPGELFHGTIAFIDPVLNTETRTVKVRVNVSNADGRLKPGMFVRAVARSQLTTDGKVVDWAFAGKWICPMHPEVVTEGPDSCTQCGMPLVPAESLGYASPSPSETEPPLVIPATAPLITGTRAIVYVARPDRPGRYEGREVLLGPRAGDFYLVRSGLAPGELVVSQGSLYLDSAAQILAKRSMMQPGPGAQAREYSHVGTAPAGANHSAAAMSHNNESRHAAPTTSSELPEPVRTQVDALFDSYFAIQHALSHDQMEAARASASDLVRAIEHVHTGDSAPITLLPDAARAEWIALHPNLLKGAQGIVSSKAVDAARAAFEGVSNGMITLAAQVGTGRRNQVLVYHCPMALDNRGARWMQEREGVENPYFGAAMFTCGVLKESIGPGSRQPDMPGGKGGP